MAALKKKAGFGQICLRLDIETKIEFSCDEWTSVTPLWLSQDKSCMQKNIVQNHPTIEGYVFPCAVYKSFCKLGKWFQTRLKDVEKKPAYQMIQKAKSKYLSSKLPMQNQNPCNTSETN